MSGSFVEPEGGSALNRSGAALEPQPCRLHEI
jgi:hypothetical protein